jgi:hypothetical protein
VSGTLPTTTMRFGAFPSADVVKSDGAGSVQQVSSDAKPSRGPRSLEHHLEE